MKVSFLTTGIGRGHQFYLEGLMRAFQAQRPGTAVEQVRAEDISTGIARKLWRLILRLYKFGSADGVAGVLYNRLRKSRGADVSSFITRRLQAGLKGWVESQQANLLVVDHPLIASIIGSLRDRPRLVYMHGELVAPPESLTTRADLTLVPTEEVREEFISAGLSSEKILQTGLCVEPALAAQRETARSARLERLKSECSLTGAFFSSGAEPRSHLRKIINAVKALSAELSAELSEDRAVSFVFARSGGELERQVAKLKLPNLQLVSFESVVDEESKLSQIFERIDYFVAPSHERTNWALGLGLPFIMLGPCYGSFAPLNFELAERMCGAEALITDESAAEFPALLSALRDFGKLKEMNITASSESFGSAKIDGLVDGFVNAARALESLV